MESNPNIRFFCISYDKNTHELVFVCNDHLDVSKWTDQHSPKSQQPMIEQIKNEDIVSLLQQENQCKIVLKYLYYLCIRF